MPINTLVRATVRLILQLILVTLLAFLLLSISPIEPINYYVDGQMMSMSAEQRELLAQSLGFDQSTFTQFLAWGDRLLQGDLGTSLKFKQPVWDIIVERFPASLMLMGVSWLLALCFGYLLGLTAALCEQGSLDRLISRLAWILACIPSFWLGLILIYVFAVSLNIFPVCCAAPLGMDPDQVPFWTLIQHLLLPSIALACVSLPPIILHTREKVLDVLASEHVNYARIHGIPSRRIIHWHLLRNTLTPALVLQFASMAELFSGSVLAETVFNFPGLGNSLVLAGLSGDTALLMGITLISALFIFAGNSLANVLRYALLPEQERAS